MIDPTIYIPKSTACNRRQFGIHGESIVAYLRSVDETNVYEMSAPMPTMQLFATLSAELEENHATLLGLMGGSNIKHMVIAGKHAGTPYVYDPQQNRYYAGGDLMPYPYFVLIYQHKELESMAVDTIAAHSYLEGALLRKSRKTRRAKRALLRKSSKTRRAKRAKRAMSMKRATY
jgi:hypothetical protein